MARAKQPPTTRSPECVDQDCLAFNLRRASRLVSQAYDNAYRSISLRSTQFALLYNLSKIQPATMQELAGELDVDRTTLTRNLAPLEKDGYLTICRGEDQREKCVELTEKGTETLREGFPAWHGIQSEIEKKFGRQETLDLIAALRRLADTLN